MTIYVVLSVFVARRLVGPEDEKGNAIRKINNYLLAKLFVNLVVANVYVWLLADMYKSKIWYVLPAIISLVFSVVDSMALYEPVKRFRGLECSKRQYYMQVAGDNVMLYLAWLMTSLLHIFGGRAHNDYLFFIGYFVFWIAVGLVIMHMRKVIMKCQELSNAKLKNIVTRHKLEGYKIYEYDGKARKSANAMVDSMFGRGNIYFSDYLLDNMTEGEIEAIYLHELGHIKNHHITIRNVLLIMTMPLMSCVGAIMDNIEQVWHINIVLGIAVGMGILIGYMVFLYLYISRRQEYEADEYSVGLVDDREVLCKALVKLNQLNDVLESDKGTVVFKTHPTVKKRIDRIRTVRCER